VNPFILTVTTGYITNFIKFAILYWSLI